MAHQYVHEVLGKVDESAHGPAFRELCARLGIDAGAAGVPAAGAPSADDARVLERIARLLALAESANVHEAQAAMNAAQRLMLKHNLEQPRRRGAPGALRLPPPRASPPGASARPSGCSAPSWASTSSSRSSGCRCTGRWRASAAACSRCAGRRPTWRWPRTCTPSSRTRPTTSGASTSSERRIRGDRDRRTFLAGRDGRLPREAQRPARRAPASRGSSGSATPTSTASTGSATRASSTCATPGTPPHAGARTRGARPGARSCSTSRSAAGPRAA